MFQPRANRTYLKDLVSKECVLAPCIYDCMSARAAEICGYKAILLSGGEIEEAGMGLPNLGIHSIDYLSNIVYNITATNSLPLIVDMDNGFGGPLAIYRNVEKLVLAGASAVQIEDKTSEGPDRYLSRKDHIAKIRAAVAACEGSNCIVIARTQINLEEDFEEAVARALEAREVGAQMTLCSSRTNEQAKAIAERVPGWKMFPDIGYRNGKPTADVPTLEKLGYNLVTMHFFLKSAVNGMIRDGRENLKNMNNAYTCQQEVDGIYGASGMPFWNAQEFLEFESKFTLEKKEWKGPAPR